MPRDAYKKHSDNDKERIQTAYSEGRDWKATAEALGVPYKTAYRWIREDPETERPKRGGSRKRLSEEQIDQICFFIEEDPSLTLKQIATKVQTEMHVAVSPSTVHSYLLGRVITLKKAHAEPIGMNSPENKNARQNFVQRLSTYMRPTEGKSIIWMDETNLNLFTRRTQGRAVVGQRAAVKMPNSKGPNVHIIGAMTSFQFFHYTRLRGAFNANKAKDWVLDMLLHLPAGIQPENIVLVLDNAPCHSKIHECTQTHPGLVVLKLAPYSPMLNPIETIWSKVKAYIKERMRVPDVAAPGVGEQRLVYVENLIDEALLTVTGQNCVHAVQHSTSFFAAALNTEDMQVGR